MNIADLDLALIELSAAQKAHFAWLSKLLELSLLGGEPDADIIHPRAHHLCHFSRWLRNHQNQHAQHSGYINDIETAHKTMHDNARELMYAISLRSVNAPVLRHFYQSQQAFIGCIDKYRECLLLFRNMHDTLTGLPLRHLLYQDFDFIRARCERSQQALWLLIMDIDRFKSINDTWGHNAGDDVLRSVAATLKKCARKNERIYRFGGEEFIMLLEVAGENEAQQASSRICHYLARHPAGIKEDIITVTVTGGLTRVGGNETLHQAIGRADKAMYFGKNNGRNQCVMIHQNGDIQQLK